ncbi:hypothetical protein ABW19_dt0207593 [Dactylella cylindrospora]|nr:hypothetical protein ABW19_dt0207593 [Dactylella cylindrospora]
MRSAAILPLTTLVALVASRPLEGEGGMVIQRGNGDTILGMHYEHIPSILEKGEAEDSKESNKSSESSINLGEGCDHGESDPVLAKVTPNPREETIIIMDATPTSPEFILPGLMGLFTPQQVSPPPPTPAQEALEAVEAVIEELKGKVPDNPEIDVE